MSSFCSRRLRAAGSRAAVPASQLSGISKQIMRLLAAALFVVTLGIASVSAASFTSTGSGSWGDAATWGGAGVPGAGDDVTIAAATTVTLDTTRSANNLSINSGGTLDLNGQQFNFANTGTTFTNNGTLTNTAAFNIFYFFGNSTLGQVVQSFAGAGTYSGNVQVRLLQSVTVNVNASTSMTFNSALNLTNLQVDANSLLDVTNALTVTAPSSGASYMIITENGTVSGAGGLKTVGNVNTVSGSASFTAPFEVVSGAPQGYGTFNGAFTIDSGASFKLGGTLILNSSLTIQSAATLDLNGQQVNFQGNNTTFTNNGTLTNTAAFNIFYFFGNGTPGQVVQSFASTGTYSGNVQVRLLQSVTVNVNASTSMTFNSALNATNLQVDANSILDVTNALTVTAPSSGASYMIITENGTISGAGGLKTVGNVNTVSGSASFTAPFEVVSGAAQGYGTFNGAFTIDSGASFKLGSTLILNSSLTIQSTATLDLNGQQVNFQGSNTTFTNNGTLTNTAAFNIFYFFGNGTPGQVVQSFAGAGTYSSNLQLRLLQNVTVLTTSSTALTGLLNLQVDAGSTLNLTSTLTFTGPIPPSPTFALITINGLIIGSTLQTQGNVQINSSGTFNVPLEVVSDTTQSQGNFSNPLTIDNTGTFKLTSTWTSTGNLTINSGGTLDLNGQQVNLQGNNTTFTNNGTLTNTAAFNIFYFFGNGTPGQVVQSFAGAGTYSGNVQVRLLQNVTVNVNASTSMTFNSALNATNFQVDANSILDTTNALTVTAPSSGATYVGIAENGTISGAGGLKTVGNVNTVSGSASFTAPFEVVSGAAQGYGTFNGAFTIDSGASFKMGSTLILNSDLTIQSTAMLDFNGQQMSFQGNNTTFANNGSVINTGAFNNLFFFGNNTPGAITQHFATSAGTFTPNLLERLLQNVTVVLDGEAQLGSVQIDGGSTLDITNRTLKLSGPGTAITVNGTIITPGSTIEFNGTAPQSVTNLGVASFNNLTINNPAGVDIANPGATIPGTLTLTSGVLTLNGILTMGDGATIARSAGSLNSSPTFAGAINILYFGSNAISSAFEIPVSNTINNLTDTNTSTVTLSASLTVNGNIIVAAGALTGAGVTTLTFNGLTFTNNGTVSHPEVYFNMGQPVQDIAGTGAWTGGEVSIGAATGHTVRLLNNVTFSVGLFLIDANNIFDTNGFTLTFNGTTITNSGSVNGLIKTTGANVTLNPGAGFNASLNVNAGATTANTGTINGSVTIDATSTALQVGPAQTLTVTGNVTNNGTLSGAGAFRFNGAMFTNNSIVSVSQVEFGGPAQILIGTGSFTGNTVTILSGSTTTLGSDHHMSTVVINTGGAFNISNRTLFLSGAGTPLTVNGTFTITGSTVEYDGSSPQTLPASVTYNNLTLNNPAGVTGFAGLIVNGLLRVKAGTFTGSGTYNNVQIDSGATLAATASTINVSGDWTNNGGTFMPNNGTVDFNSTTADQTIAGSASSQTFFNVTMNKSGRMLSVGGSTTTLNLNTLTLNDGTFSAGTAGTINVTGDWSDNGGTFLPGLGVVVFNGNVLQQISGTGPTSQTFNDIQVNNGNILEVAGTTTTLTLNGSLTIASGEFQAGNAANINVAGNWNNDATFTSGAGTVNFNGSATRVIGGSGFTLFNNLTISNTSGGVSLSSDEEVDGTLTLTSGALSIGSHHLNLNGAISSGGGTLTGGSNSNITFGGAGGSTSLPAVLNGLRDLTIERASGIALGADLTVGGTLALTSGDLSTGSSTLTMPNTATSTGTTDVVGNVKRTGFTTGNTLSFGNPSNFIHFTSGAPPADVTVNLVKAKPSGAIGFSTAVNRTYTITPNGGSGYTATLRLHYQDADLNGNIEGQLNLWRFNGTEWERKAETAFDSTANWAENNSVTQFSPWTLNSLVPTAAPSTISGRITNPDGTPLGGVLVTLTGGVEVRRAMTTAAGVYSFLNVETNNFYTATPLRANYVFSPVERSFTLLGNKTDALFTGGQTGETANPLDTPDFFVRQHYLDFLDREPEQEGLDYWSAEVRNCATDEPCVNSRRIGVSAAFFIEQEFQQTGSFVYRMYKASLGRQPNYGEFSADRAQVIGGVSLTKNQQAFADEWVRREAFKQQYPDSMSASEFVNKVFDTTGLQAFDQRQQQIDAMTSGGKTRAAVLRDVIEIADFKTREYNPSFVLMQYFGYLRRNPEQDGYTFWLDVLNNREPNNYLGMVCSFITSTEYQNRFSSVVTHTNTECGQ